VEQAVAAVRPRFIDAGIEIELAESVVVGDEVSLRCMLVNLLENALEAAPPPGWVRLQARPRSGFVQLTVEDRSGGLPAEIKDRLFGAFVTTKPRGTGLGLTVVREICRAHGGSVEVDANAKGSRFVVTLPCERSMVEHET
jgi:signal transduction histidine kinase